MADPMTAIAGTPVDQYQGMPTDQLIKTIMAQASGQQIEDALYQALVRRAVSDPTAKSFMDENGPDLLPLIKQETRTSWTERMGGLLRGQGQFDPTQPPAPSDLTNFQRMGQHPNAQQIYQAAHPSPLDQGDTGLNNPPIGSDVSTQIPADIRYSRSYYGDNPADLGSYAFGQKQFDPSTVGIEPWMQKQGIGTNYLALSNPLSTNPDAAKFAQQAILQSYADENQLPGYFAKQEQPLYATMPYLYAMDNPTSPGLDPVDMARMADEFGGSGTYGMSASALSPSAEFNKFMAPGGGATPAGTESSIATMDPGQQVAQVSQAMQALTPYLGGQQADNMMRMLSDASDRWQTAVAKGATPYDFMDWLRNVEGADQWMGGTA